MDKWWSEYVVDVNDYRNLAASIETSPDDFKKETLASLEGMSWLNFVDLELVVPVGSTVEVQRKQIDLFLQDLKGRVKRLTHEQYPKLYPQGFDEPYVAYDTETYGLDTRVRYNYDGYLTTRVPLVGVSIASDGETGWYLPVRHSEEDGILNWNPTVITELMDRLNTEFVTICHNAMYDREVLALNGVTGLRPWPYFIDTQILDFLKDVNTHRHGLKYLSETLLGRKMIEIEELFKGVGSVVKKGDKTNIFFEKLPASSAFIYAGSDAINTYKLFEYYQENMQPFTWFDVQSKPMEIDHRCVDMIRDMKRVGLPIKYRYFYYTMLDVLQRLNLLQQAIFKGVGFEFKVGSPKEIAHVLFDVLQIEPLPGEKKSTAGYYSTKEEKLDKLLERNPDVQALRYIVMYRKLTSNLSKIYMPTVLNSWVDAAVPWTRVMIDFNLTNVPTGRLSSSSGEGRERVTLKFNKKSITSSYDRGAWGCGFNSQGIPSHFYSTVKAKKLTRIPSQAGIDELYPLELRKEVLVGSQILGKDVIKKGLAAL